jgi:hypothetical protein
MPGPSPSRYAHRVFEAERDQESTEDARVDTATEEGPALRDASATIERIADDERQAAAARDRLRDQSLAVLEPDGVVRTHLESGELVHSSRRSAILEPPGGRGLGYGGSLYLTSRRLLHIGQVTMGVRLDDITETSVAGERLLVTLEHAEGLSFDIDRPRVFRAEIAAAVRGLRR